MAKTTTRRARSAAKQPPAPQTVDASQYEGFIESGQDAVAADSLSSIRMMAVTLMDKELAVEAAKTVLEKAEAELAQVREHDLPDMMDQFDLPEFKFRDEGTGAIMKVAVGDETRVSLPKDNRAAGHAWLRKMKLESVIKTDVIVPVGRDAKRLPKKIEAAVKKIDKTLKPAYVEKVEPATLKATIIAQIEAGTNVPLDVFNIYRQRVASVTVD